MHDIAVADIETRVAAAVEGDHIAGLQRVHRDRSAGIELLIAGPGQFATGLLIGPLHQARAVESVRARSTVGVGRTHLGQRRIGRALTDRLLLWRGRQRSDTRNLHTRRNRTEHLVGDIEGTDTRDGDRRGTGSGRRKQQNAEGRCANGSGRNKLLDSHDAVLLICLTTPHPVVRRTPRGLEKVTRT